MLLYYHSWVFYNHFIATLYHFLGLTYWHSAECQLLFLLVFYFTEYQYQTESKCNKTFWRLFWTRRHLGGQESTCKESRGDHNTPGCARRPRHTLVGCGAHGVSCTASQLYKYPNIPETLGESTKHNSSCRKFQNHEIQSRYHHRGVQLLIGASPMMRE